VRRRCHDLLAAHDFGLEPLTNAFAQMRGFRIDHSDPVDLRRSKTRLRRFANRARGRAASLRLRA
jgi:hypothetical protein